MHHTARAAPRRAALAEAAARRELAGLPPGPVLARLRLLTTAELLCPARPGPCGTELCGELAVLCAAADAAVRRRPGWLRAGLGGGPLPVGAPPRLVQAAVLSVWRCALLGGGAAELTCRRAGGAAVLVLQGGSAARLARSDAALLLRRFAACAGGTLMMTANGCGRAVLRLPLREGAPCRPADTAALLRDRYSLLYVYLAGYCAGG